MALNTTMPSDIKTTNALDDIPADLLGPIPAEIRLGANTLMVMEEPPANGETVTVIARLRIWRTGTDQQGEDAEERHFRQGKIVAAWVQGQPEPPDPEAEQPGLFDGDSEPTEDEDGEPDDVDNVARPDFSSEGK
jgi:hypothetical protein